MPEETVPGEMTAIDPAGLSGPENYRLLTGCVVPRPIAWVTSVAGDGTANLAPFSAFTMVSNDPPMVGINIGRRDGGFKDTARNIAERGEYVVNIPGWELWRDVHRSGEVHPPEVDEAALLGLATVPADVVGVPRLAAARVSLECRLARVVEFGRAGAQFTVGEVVRFHVLSSALDGLKIDTAAIDPASRLAGPTYARLGGIERVEGAAAPGPARAASPRDA
ncbi:NADH-FMN oxidoreductase RutF, flavin reductase (DIM6/NTAB) family [Nocardiopsis flavescens]|uniref:NADH-FMN oxidoreductase RutF, flavin reductase (DIM6/NTAB) family n=1 Tax=Nocardiopsis flavescens TaxID=758803 RepID=A0A1M6V3D5_9ACTN|nr:flavin reductase family protein [Nocardiopsis flavescens]SHK75973.1 NADH-FMN oxidoreductase RutF, flavin reductase (DIM6/NTAB) family [Nocardiopsis flavescens]